MDFQDLDRDELIALAERQAAELAALRAATASAAETLRAALPEDGAGAALPAALARRDVPDETQEEDFGPAVAVAPRRVDAPLVALLLGLAALALGGVGEYILRTTEAGWPGALCLIAGAALLAASSPRFAMRPLLARVLERDATAPARRWRVVLVTGGALLGLGLAIATALYLRDDLHAPAARWLYPLSLLAVGLPPLLVIGWERVAAPRWGSDLPASRRGRLWLALGVIAVIAAAVAARFLWLDRIPFGINPDEGDRTAVALQVIRATTPLGIFDTGWYRINMMYFYMLAEWLKWVGQGYVQARLFTATFGVLTAAAVTWIGLRHFGWRMGLPAGLFMGVPGLMLQYSRETGEASPTAALWAISMGCLLEAVRTGRSWAWALAGLAGGFSIYFYPTGRMWGVFVALFCIYLLIHAATQARSARLHGQSERWLPLLGGMALAAAAAVVVSLPFFVQISVFPHEFALRLEETSIFTAGNPSRLGYYNPEWSTARFLLEQLWRTLGVFSHFPDGSGFWPMHEPVLGPVLALLGLLGLGAASLRWRDPRAVLLALWFWVGFVGVVITVETPNVLRIATSVPALALLMAATLDGAAARAIRWWQARAGEQRARAAPALVTAAAFAVALGALAAEAKFYFVDYAAMNLWEGWNQEGRAARNLPPGTQVLSLGSSFHMINSGWVRLVAIDAERAGVPSPGSVLPLATDGGNDLAFYVYPGQKYYTPYLRGLYPGAEALDYRLAGEGFYFDLLRVRKEDVAAARGARLTLPGAPPQAVAAPGVLPDGVALPDGKTQPPTLANARWTTTLRVPQQWNYAFRMAGAERGARLLVDGVELLAVEPGGTGETVTAMTMLPRGDHGMMLAAPLARGDDPIVLEWAKLFPGAQPEWRTFTPEDLRATDAAVQGLLGRVEVGGRPPQTRQDNALATCCLQDLLGAGNAPFSARWSGTISVTTPGVHEFRFNSAYPLRFWISGIELLDVQGGGEFTTAADLPAGSHAVEIAVQAHERQTGVFEWAWLPPGGELSIVPPDALAPAAEFGPGGLLPEEWLHDPDNFPTDKPLAVVE